MKIYQIYISYNSNYCSWNGYIELKHFYKIISILVFSEKIYLISLKLQPIKEWSRWKLLNEIYDTYSVHIGQNTSYLDISSQLPKKKSSHWRFIRYYRSSNSKHFGSNWDFESGHFIAILAITVMSLKIYKIWQKL